MPQGLGTVWHAVGLVVVGFSCLALMILRIFPEAFSRPRSDADGPQFEVGDPNAPDPSQAPTPLIQVMHRIRGKRPPRE